MATMTSEHPAWKAFKTWFLETYHVEPNLAIIEHQRIWRDFLGGWESVQKGDGGVDIGLVINPEGK